MMLVRDSSSACNPEKKKSKKRSFLQKQKRFAKHGSFGRGTQLTSDMYEYFINILKVINIKKDDEEEMCVLASNVFQEINGKEAEYCCNQIISRVVENLLSFSSDEKFFEFLDKFSENLRPLFSDPFGSHVLQQTLIVAYIKYIKLSNKPDNKLRLLFHNYILKISNFLFNNLEDFLWNTYSNAIARTVLNVLSGNPVKNDIKLNLDKLEENKVSDEFESVIEKFAKKIMTWPQFNDLCNQPINSMFLQSLLLASKNSDERFKLVRRIVGCCESKSLDLMDEQNNAFLRLLEVALCAGDEKSFQKIYKLMFNKCLVQLALSKSGNFAVQKLIMNCPNKKIFSKIYCKLGSHFDDLLNVGQTGVLLMLIKGCQKFELVEADCEKKANIKKRVNFVQNFLELPESNLVKLLGDVRGSQIIDTILKMPAFGEKRRDKLFKKLKGHYFVLATSKYGSRSLDVIWSVMKVHQKILVAEELKEKQSELTSDIYGKIFARNIHLESFRRKKEEWIKLQRTSEMVEKYFANIIPAKKRKKN